MSVHARAMHLSVYTSAHRLFSQKPARDSSCAWAQVTPKLSHDQVQVFSLKQSSARVASSCFGLIKLLCITIRHVLRCQYDVNRQSGQCYRLCIHFASSTFSRYPSLSVFIGQFLVGASESYHAIGRSLSSSQMNARGRYDVTRKSRLFSVDVSRHHLVPECM
jgi:hypothetical protein